MGNRIELLLFFRSDSDECMGKLLASGESLGWVTPPFGVQYTRLRLIEPVSTFFFFSLPKGTPVAHNHFVQCDHYITPSLNRLDNVEPELKGFPESGITALYL